MVFVASKDPQALVQGSPHGDLCLRIVGTARDGQLVKLTAAKCSIGSAPGCTLRLRARGVRSVHCLLLRGARGTVARAWAPNTRLNGQPFQDALINVGDRLTVGPIEFEVVASEDPPADPFDAGRTVVLDRRPADHTLTTTLLAAAPETRPNRQRRHRRRAHLRRLIGEVRKLRQEVERFEREANEAAATQADQLRERAEAIRQQNAHWEATLASLQEEVAARGQALEAERAELAAARENVEQQREQLEQQRLQFEQLRALFEQHRELWEQETAAEREQLALRDTDAPPMRDTLTAAELESERRLAQLEDELAAARQQIEQLELERSQHTSQQQQLTDQQQQLAAHEQQLAERQQQLDQLATQLDERARQLDAQQQELEAARLADERVSQELAACRAAFEAEQATALHQLDAERSQWEAERDASEQHLRREAERLHALSDELLARNQASGQFAAELPAAGTLLSAWLTGTETDRDTLRDQLELRATQLDQREAELTQRQTELDQRQTDLDQRYSDLDRRQSDLDQRELELTQRQTELQARLEAPPAPDTADIDVEALRDQLAELAARELTVQRSCDELAAARESFAAERAEALAELEALRAALADEQQALFTERQNLAAEQQTLAADRQDFLTQQEQAAAQLRERSAELDRRQQEHQDWQTRLQSQQTQLETQLDAAAQTAAQVSPAGEPSAADRADLEAARAALEAARAELDAARAELAAQRERLQAERQEFECIRLRTNDRLDAEARELAEQREQLDAEREAWLERQRIEQARRSPAPQFSQDESGGEPGLYSEFSPQRRPAPSSIRSDEDTVRQFGADTVRQPQPLPQLQPSDDDSIESHIAEFLNRVRANSPPPVVTPEPSSRRKSDPRPDDAPRNDSTPAESPPVAETPVLDMPAAPRELERRRTKLEEDPKHLRVLREIGLSHARSAIAHHGQRRTLRQAYGSLGTSAACLIAAFFVLWFNNNRVLHTAGIAILVVAIYWMVSSIWAAQKVLNVMKRRRHNAGGLRATLAEVEAELENLRKEQEAEQQALELQAQEAQQQNTSSSS